MKPNHVSERRMYLEAFPLLKSLRRNGWIVEAPYTRYKLIGGVRVRVIHDAHHLLMKTTSRYAAHNDIVLFMISSLIATNPHDEPIWEQWMAILRICKAMDEEEANDFPNDTSR